MAYSQSFSTKHEAKLDASGPHPVDEDPQSHGQFRKQSQKATFVFKYQEEAADRNCYQRSNLILKESSSDQVLQH